MNTLDIPKTNRSGFDGHQRYALVEGLIKGYLGIEPFDAGKHAHVEIPNDGTLI